MTLFTFGSVIGKGSIKKKILNFPDLVGGWVRKSPFSRFEKNKKYALKMPKYLFENNLYSTWEGPTLEYFTAIDLYRHSTYNTN